MKEKEWRKERYDLEMGNFEPVTNKNLVCNDCKFVYLEVNRVSICEIYKDMKPSKVLYGKTCMEYEPTE